MPNSLVETRAEKETEIVGAENEGRRLSTDDCIPAAIDAVACQLCKPRWEHPEKWHNQSQIQHGG